MAAADKIVLQHVPSGPVTTTAPVAPPDAVGRRERKRNQTHAELVAAATRLFAERGFDETTTEAIAEAADVSQRTFFRHFASKEAVLYGESEELAAGLRDAILAR